jgi:5'-methylthioadenosine phosphorylase
MIGVFGGSGFYAFLDDAAPALVPHRYGPPSATPAVGTVDGIEVAFIPRHGPNHEHPPHKVPFRANVHAMRELGVDRIIASTAVGSLAATYEPGHFAVPDQIVDRTWGRDHTFWDGPDVEHVSFADPYHQGMRSAAIDAMREVGAEVHDGGTVVVIQGPRFSTRAESADFASRGWELINMTQMPEAALCAEAGIAYANISVITDYDVGIDGGDPVTHDEVLRRFAGSSATLQAGIRRLVPMLGGLDLEETR